MAKSKEPEIGSAEWTINWMEKRRAKRISQAISMKDLGAYLKDLGYKFIRVWYEGSGDSGECYTAEGWKGRINLKDDKNWTDHYQHMAYNHDKKENFDKWKDMTRNQKELRGQFKLFKEHHPDNNLGDELEYILSDLIDYDWYNNEGGQGSVVWDLKKGEIFVDGEQNAYACNTTTEKYFLSGTNPVYTWDDKIQERA